MYFLDYSGQLVTIAPFSQSYFLLSFTARVASMSVDLKPRTHKLLCGHSLFLCGHSSDPCWSWIILKRQKKTQDNKKSCVNKPVTLTDSQWQWGHKWLNSLNATIIFTYTHTHTHTHTVIIMCMSCI